jgi:hypothetical protein
MESMKRISTLLWLVGLGVLGLYVWALVVGFFDPAEMIALTVAVAIFCVAFAVHSVHVRRAMQDHGHPAHDELMRSLHYYRERRGF